jgi:hypothetical protein
MYTIPGTIAYCVQRGQPQERDSSWVSPARDTLPATHTETLSLEALGVQTLYWVNLPSNKDKTPKWERHQ